MANYKSRYAERTCVDYHLAYERRDLNGVRVTTKMAASFQQFSLTTVPSSVVVTSLPQTLTHQAPNIVRDFQSTQKLQNRAARVITKSTYDVWSHSLCHELIIG